MVKTCVKSNPLISAGVAGETENRSWKNVKLGLPAYYVCLWCATQLVVADGMGG